MATKRHWITEEDYVFLQKMRILNNKISSALQSVKMNLSKSCNDEELKSQKIRDIRWQEYRNETDRIRIENSVEEAMASASCQMEIDDIMKNAKVRYSANYDIFKDGWVASSKFNAQKSRESLDEYCKKWDELRLKFSDIIPG